MTGIPEVGDVDCSRKDDNRREDARDEVGRRESGRSSEAAGMGRATASCRRSSRGRAAPWI